MMKSWAADHPKAKLMGKKRAAILSAAREAFLSCGYEKASMEAIAAAAGVSIMTLYRHARTKDGLFEAIVSEICAPNAGSEAARAAEAVLAQPLVDILTFIADRFRERMMHPETLGLLRAVMVERTHFPHLGEMAFEGLIASHIRQMETFIASRPEATDAPEERRSELVAAFFDRLMGTDQLKALLGLPSDDSEASRSLSNRAARDFVEALARG